VQRSALRRKLNWYHKRLRGLLNRLSGRVYPKSLFVPEANQETLTFVRSTRAKTIAEIGVYEGKTSEGFADFLAGEGELHLFDFAERVSQVKQMLNQRGYTNVVAHGNSHKTLDSYNWGLMRMLQEHRGPVFDYVFLDGAHTWNVDALTFFLADRLLRVGGHIDFDDYSWSLESSPSLNPVVFPLTAQLYTLEQIEEQHVKLIVDLLVKRSPRYVEVVENKIYKKIASDQ